MATRKVFGSVAICGALALAFGGSPAAAQETQEHQEVVVQKIVVAGDGSDGEHVFGMIIGPDGVAQTFGNGDGPIILNRGVAGGLMLGGGPGRPGIMGGLDVIDPGRTYVHPLSRRTDVRSEILMTARQREAFETMEKTGRTDLQKRMKEHFQGLQSLSGKSGDEIRKEVEERTKQSKEIVQQFQSAQDHKMAEILTPKQMRRLKELDMQWRGPLALAVAEVAEAADVPAEVRTQIDQLLQEYRKEVSKQMSTLFGGTVRISSQGVERNQTEVRGTPDSAAPPAAPPSPEEMRTKIEKASKQIEKTRKTLGEKALALLSAEQKQRWLELQGPTFRFRAER